MPIKLTPEEKAIRHQRKLEYCRQYYRAHREKMLAQMKATNDKRPTKKPRKSDPIIVFVDSDSEEQPASGL